MTRRGFFKLLPLALAGACGHRKPFVIPEGEWLRAVKRANRQPPWPNYFLSVANQYKAREWSLAKLRAMEKGFS